jgi:gamma-glutamyltranspeptidase/glutathione hydrolase
MRWLIALVPALLFSQATWRPVVMGKRGMVVAEHPLQAREGLRILESGGNAIDAALAVFYMTAVTEPSEAGLGGDGFLLAYIKKLGRVVLINGSGPAPQLATREAYLKLGKVPQDGPYSTAVPGAVSGFDVLHRQFGTKPYTALLAGAIDAAENGYGVSVWGSGNFHRARALLERWPSSRAVFFAMGRPPEPGEVIVQRELAASLRAIAKGGAREFYQGSIARKTAAFHEKSGGLIRYADLAKFEAESAPPIKIRYKDYEVYQSPPNSGGIVMLQALAILKGFDLAKLGHNSPEYLHVVAEAFKLAFADRFPYITDPKFAPDAPIAGLLSDEYAAARRKLIRMDRAIDGAAPPGDPRGGLAILKGHAIRYVDPAGTAPARTPVKQDGEQTSSFAIADRFGNVVSVTHSINGGFGSGMTVEGAGFLLNNRAGYFGLDKTDINVIAPGKRTRQGAIPAMALKNGKPVLAWNSPGGDSIPQTLTQSFLNVVEFGMSVQQAVEQPSIVSANFRASYYPQAPGDGLQMIETLARKVGAALRAKGHNVVASPAQPPYGAPSGTGAVKMLRIDPETGMMFGGASPAKDNYALAW